MNEEEQINPTSVYVWGNDTFGQLGLGKKAERTYSFPVLCTFDIAIAQVACGEEHSAFRTLEGLVYTAGSNADGRLGINDRSVKLVSTPTFVRDLSDLKVTSIACGAAHTVALAATGQVFAWGFGSSGALGTGSSLSHWRPHPVVLAEESGVERVSCGGRHTAMVSAESGGAKKLYVCGAGDAGQLGSGRRDSFLLPRVLPFSESIEEAACGALHTLFRTSTSRLFAMGANSFGQLGNGSKRSATEPVQVTGLDGIRFKQIACGSFSAALSVDGSLYVWGTGTFGEFLAPQKVKTNGGVTQVAVGSGFGVLLDRDGLLWAWGSNAGGELGQGDLESRSSPAPITTLHGKSICQVSCGASFVVALGAESSERTAKLRPSDVSVASIRNSLSELQGHSRLFRLYQSELDSRKVLELELFKEQQVKLAYMKQVESLTLENQDLRDSVRKVEAEFAQTQADVAWHSQNSLQLSSKNKTLTERLKDVPPLEQRVEDLQLSLEISEKARRKAENALEAAQSRLEDLEFSSARLTRENTEMRSALRRTEGELQETSKSLAEARKEGDKSSLEAQLAIDSLVGKQEELEKQWTARLSEQTMKTQSQEEVIRELRSRLQLASASAARFEAEASRLDSRAASLTHDLSDRDSKIEQLELLIERQEVKNKSLVEALEREVKERATSLRRAKEVLVTSDISCISPTSDEQSLTGPTNASSHSLDARIAAFERKLHLSRR